MKLTLHHLVQLVLRKIWGDICTFWLRWTPFSGFTANIIKIFLKNPVEKGKRFLAPFLPTLLWIEAFTFPVMKVFLTEWPWWDAQMFSNWYNAIKSLLYLNGARCFVLLEIPTLSVLRSHLKKKLIDCPETSFWLGINQKTCLRTTENQKYFLEITYKAYYKHHSQVA